MLYVRCVWTYALAASSTWRWPGTPIVYRPYAAAQARVRMVLVVGRTLYLLHDLLQKPAPRGATHTTSSSSASTVTTLSPSSSPFLFLSVDLGPAIAYTILEYSLYRLYIRTRTHVLLLLSLDSHTRPTPLTRILQLGSVSTIPNPAALLRICIQYPLSRHCVEV